MVDLIFYIFATLILGSALAVVFSKHAVDAALWFLFGLVGVAGIFVMLNAYLLAVLLILVYAGAVVSLFLFIVMLLDTKGGTRKPFKKATIIASTIALALLGVGVSSFITRGEFSKGPPTAPFQANLADYGAKLFTTYLLPVEVVGFLLLIAMLGVIVLSKRFEGLEDIK